MTEEFTHQIAEDPLRKLISETLNSLRDKSPQAVRNRIKRYSQTDDGKNIEFIKNNSSIMDSESQIPQNHLEAANAVYAGLLQTLDAIAGAALKKTESGDNNDYQKVLQAIEPLILVCRKLADDEIRFKLDQKSIDKRKSVGDNVYAYMARNVRLNGQDYEKVTVFIRSQPFVQALDTDNPSVQISQKADPRLSITAVPKNESQGRVHVRIDDRYMGQPKLTYDVEIGDGSQGPMDYLDFQDESIQTGQLRGHHFESKVDADEFNANFSDILTAFNAKIAAQVPNTSLPVSQ